MASPGRPRRPRERIAAAAPLGGWESGTGFAEDAYRYYLSSIDASGASYTYGGKVEWPPRASSHMVGQLADRREPVGDRTAPGVELNGD